MKIFFQILKAFCPPAVLYFFQYFLELFFRIYERYPSFDILMHFLGGVTISMTSISLLHIAEKQKWLIIKKKSIYLLFVVSFVAFFAVLWEFHEFLFDYYLGTHMQPSEFDTMKDIFLGLFGALASGIILVYKESKK